MIELLALPLAACLVLAGMHAYLGLHVLARGVIFVDLALAQVAALGVTVALLAGHGPLTPAAYAYSLIFTAVGAVIFAATRQPARAAERASAGSRGRRPADAGAPGVPQEAIIGIVYAVSAALTVLVLERVPQGTEQIKQLLVGSLVAVTADDVVKLAALYGAVGVVHWLARRPLLALSLGRETPLARAWDVAFYFTFGVVVTSSVRIAGVLLVFSYLVVPAVASAWLARTIAGRLAIAWTVGVAASVAGLALSYAADLPTGAAIVAVLGALLAGVALARAGAGFVARLRHDGPRAFTPLVGAVGGAVAIAGAALVAVPAADHVWLDAIERGVPSVETAFLTARERTALADSRDAVARGERELVRLQQLQSDVQWGTRDLPPDQRERLRQFLAGRGELVAGDRLVIRTLREHARARQRFALGVPLVVAGVVLALFAARPRSRPRARVVPAIAREGASTATVESP